LFNQPGRWGGRRKILATKRQVLEYFQSHGVVRPQDLMAVFGYQYEGALQKLRMLRKERLIEHLGDPGEWGITATGLRRLRYYAKRGSVKPQG